MADPKLVTVLPDSAALAAAAADHIVDVLRAALAQRDVADIALAGGSTPRAINALLVAAPRRDAVEWSRVVFWFGDERCVPPDDDQSNYKMNRETLLDPLGIRARAGAPHARRGRSERRGSRLRRGAAARGRPATAASI